MQKKSNQSEDISPICCVCGSDLYTPLELARSVCIDCDDEICCSCSVDENDTKVFDRWVGPK